MLEGFVAANLQTRRVVLHGSSDITPFAEQQDFNLAELGFKVVAVFLRLALIQPVNLLGRGAGTKARAVSPMVLMGTKWPVGPRFMEMKESLGLL